MTSPTARILNLAAYLNQRGRNGATLDDITRDVNGYDHGAARDADGILVVDGKEWETVRKGVQRDLNDLRTAWGIDADFDEVDNVYRLRPAFFTPAERQALIAAAATVGIEGVEGAPGQLASGVEDSTAHVVLRVHALVADLRDAITARCVVHIPYEGRERVLEPYALGAWRGRWYVAGWDPELNAMRRYRLDRIERADGLERASEPDGFHIKPGFDAVLAFDFDPNAWGRDPRLRARVRVDRDHVPAFLDDLGGELDGVSDGEPVVAFDVRHYEATRTRLLFYRDHTRVLDPPELVAILRQVMAALTKARQFEVLRTVLGVVEERGAVTLEECAELTGVPADVLRTTLGAALYVDYYTADGGLVTQSDCFLLDDNDVVSIHESHWLRDLEAGPPEPTTALRLLLAGVTMQAIAGHTPHLDAALAKLRGAVACELYLPVDVPDALATVRETIKQRRSVEVEYRSERDDAARRRELLPHRLWSKWGHWYLTARDVNDSETKQFRVDRMLSARAGTMPFDPPDDVEIPDWFDLSDAERTVRVRIRRDALESLLSPHRLGEPTDVGDGAVELDVTVMGDRRLEHLLVSLPADAEVVGPVEYAELRREHARRLLARYA
jgi:proteasome accessory factor B